MIQEVKMYTVICDNCGVDSNEGEDISAYFDLLDAKESAINADWLEVGNKHYCSYCYRYDKNNELVIEPMEAEGE